MPSFIKTAIKKVKGRVIGPFFGTAALKPDCTLGPEFPHSSPEAPRTIQAQETSTSEGGNYARNFC
jgi:hypothetical protein